MTRKEMAYEYLKNKIITAQLYPNQPIVEMEVATALKISRTPVREAMRELEKEGLIVSYQSRGSFVTSLTPYDVQEIFELRSLLECWALERSIFRITDDELTAIEKKFETAYHSNDWEPMHVADRELHNLIKESAHSKRLTVFLNTLNVQEERIRHISAKAERRSNSSYLEHLAIIQCIRERDLDKSIRSLQYHLNSVANSAVEVTRRETALPEYSFQHGSNFNILY